MKTNQTRKKIDLTPFCRPDSNSRFHGLSAPWKVGDLVYASDGKIVVEVSRTACPEVGEPVGCVPHRPADVFYGFEYAIKWRAAPKPKACKFCDSSGFELEKRGRRRGAGSAKTGDTCAQCAVKIGDYYFGAGYIRLLSALPNCQVSVAEDCLWFKFTGGRGKLMACDAERVEEARCLRGGLEVRRTEGQEPARKRR